MIKRNISDVLKVWKDEPNRKPLIIRGIRRSGKTWVLKQFGNDYFSDTAYFNFEETPAIQTIFKPECDPCLILTELGRIRGKPIIPGTTLLILDEIQFCLDTLFSLKDFTEKLPEQHIACADSLLYETIENNLSFLTEQVYIVTLHPLNFGEFLRANNKETLITFLDDSVPLLPLPEPVTTELNRLCQEYFITGGMPEAVSDWITHHDCNRVEEIHRQILQDYLHDISIYAPKKERVKMYDIIYAIPNQLAKKNRRFMLSYLKKGAETKDYETAVWWLAEKAGIVHKVERLTRPGIPLEACLNHSNFKLYFADVGLLRTLAGITAEEILTKTDNPSEIRKALTENFVLTELLSRNMFRVYYWKYDWREGEVDFVVKIGKYTLPFEVNNKIHLWPKALIRYQELYLPDIILKISHDVPQYYSSEAPLKFPLYFVWRMPEFIISIITLRDLILPPEERQNTIYGRQFESASGVPARR